MIKCYGKTDFINKPYTNDDDPKTTQSTFSWKLNSTVFIDFPPYFTMVN